MTIDAHHHLWHYSPDLYGWIGDGMDALKRDFTADDLVDQIGPAGVDATVVVQARQDLVETEWLLGTAAQTPEIAGVVGWVDLCDRDGLSRTIERLSENPAFVGVRHVLQDEPDDAFMLRDDFNRGVARLAEYGLAYDILIYPRHLENATALVDRHPDQTFVLDHLAKPEIRKGELGEWKSRLSELARREHCYCKMSGVVTEADWPTWTAAELQPYLEVALESFGPERLMFGSDWPVCLLASSYDRWLGVVTTFTSGLSRAERERIFGGTAAEAYGLALET